MSKIKPIKIAILSCNHGHGKAYYELQDDPMFDLVGVSVEPGYRTKVALERIPNVPKYDSDEELYQNHPDIEAVIIASANKKHIEQVRVAAEKGLHIFSMKIPTFDRAEYDEMIELVEKAGVVCQVELEMRYAAELRRVKELIEEGAIGKPLSISMINYSHNPIWWRPWQCSPEESYGRRVCLREGDGRYRGGALADHPHIFDAVRYITGSEFDTVFAEVSPNIRDVETEDMIHLIGTLKNGMIYSLDPSYANDEYKVPTQVDWMKYPRPVEVMMNVVGTEGTIIADLYGKTAYAQKGQRGDYATASDTHIPLWNRMMNEFYHCIRHGETPHVHLRNHRHSIDVMNAAYESVTEGKLIRL